MAFLCPEDQHKNHCILASRNTTYEVSGQHVPNRAYLHYTPIVKEGERPLWYLSDAIVCHDCHACHRPLLLNLAINIT